MDAQELRNLQEAYMDVYSLSEKLSDDTITKAIRYIRDTKKLVKSMGREIDAKYHPEPEGYEPEPEKKIKKRTQQEQVDIYDIILSHLLDEGYAETIESAEAIMVNMSEEWREDVIETVMGNSYRPNPIGDAIKTGASLAKGALRNQNVSGAVKTGVSALRGALAQNTSKTDADGTPWGQTRKEPLWDDGGSSSQTKPPVRRPNPPMRDEPLW